jgi:hypothetical protein
MPFKYPSMEDRIIANSVLSDECAYGGSWCWDWVGKRVTSRLRGGLWYGVLNVRFQRGPRKGRVKSMLAHRVSLNTFKGARLTTRMVGRHLCNNTLCVNPEHLTTGSQRQNNCDTVQAGHHRNQYT